LPAFDVLGPAVDALEPDDEDARIRRAMDTCARLAGLLLAQGARARITDDPRIESFSGTDACVESPRRLCD